MRHNLNNQPKDVIERLGGFTARAQAIGAGVCAVVGLLPAAAVLGVGATLDYAGTTMYKDYRTRAHKKLGKIATTS